MAYFHRYSAGAGCVPPTATPKYLARDDVCGRQNAVARQRFCPLQGLVFDVLFSEKRGRAGIWAQAGFSNARAGFFLTASRTEPWPATGTVLDLLAARVTGENALARGDARGYIAHVEIPFAGYARQRGPAFSLPGTGSIG